MFSVVDQRSDMYYYFRQVSLKNAIFVLQTWMQ